MLTVKEIEKRVARITRIADENDEAHREEDALMRDVLAAIADGSAEDPARCAAAALKAWEIHFTRWYS